MTPEKGLTGYYHNMRELAEDRYESATVALRAHIDRCYSNGESWDDPKDRLTDLMCNLAHLGFAMGLTLDQMLDRVRSNFEAEMAEDQTHRFIKRLWAGDRQSFEEEL